jgi:FixJ family two-component response regulator
MKREPPAATVFLVDDDAQVTKALARLLREHGLQTAVFNSAEDFVARQDASMPGCLVLDLAMPGLDGLALQRLLAELGRPWPIVFLTGNGDIPSSVKAMKAGAVDFLTKPVPAQTLLAAVQAGLAQDALARQAREQDDALAARHAQLTRREREVLDCLSQGKLNKQIAAELGIVEPTVKFHRARIMERMGARTLAELMLLAARLGLPAARAEPAPERGDYPKG